MASNRFLRVLKIITGTNAGAEEELLHLEGKVECSLHFAMLVWRHFVRNRCLIRASALAYTTLLALIPLLAVIISISTSLLNLKDQNDDKFYQAIASIMPPPAVVSPSHHYHRLADTTNDLAAADVTTNLDDEMLAAGQTNQLAEQTNDLGSVTNEQSAGLELNTQKDLARALHNLVRRTQGGAVGVTGMVVFVVIAIMMLSRIEETFNDIWGVTRGRNWLTRVVLYWAAITLGPVLILIAISLAGSAHFQSVKDYFHQIPIFGNFILELLPLMVLWVTFTFIYQIVPNTRVKFSAALVGGLVAGTAWHLNTVFGFIYVSRAVTNSQMYGKLAVIPLFMLGLYFSWAILLFGAQVAYAYQNRTAYLQDKLAENVNQRGREFVALRIMTVLGQHFQNGLRPATVTQLSTELGVPSRLTQRILLVLGNANLVTEVGGAETAYVPARPLDSINAHHILVALRSGSGRELPVNDAPELTEIYGEFGRIEAAERVAAEKISMLTLVNRTPAALPAPAAAAPEKCLVTLPPMESIRPPEVISAAEPPAAEPVVEMVTAKTERLERNAEAGKISEVSKTRPEAALPEERDFPL